MASWVTALGAQAAPDAKKHSAAAAAALATIQKPSTPTPRQVELIPLLDSKAQGHHPRDDRRDREAAPGQRLLEEEHRCEGPAAVSRDAAV